jgi:hypothetical protein
MNTLICYLCSKRPTFMMMNIITSFGLITFPICKEDFIQSPSDVHLAAEAMSKAILGSGAQTPVEIGDVPGILQKMGLQEPLTVNVDPGSPSGDATVITLSNSDHLPSGLYSGTWGGWEVKIEGMKSSTTLKMPYGVRTLALPVLISISEEVIFVIQETQTDAKQQHEDNPTD